MTARVRPRVSAAVQLVLLSAVLVGQGRLTTAEWECGREFRLDFDPLLPTWPGLVACLLALAATWLGAWRLHAGGTTLGRHVAFVLFSAIPAFLCFEITYLFSRFPPISEISFSNSLRPWTRCLPMPLGVFCFCWLGLALNHVGSSWPAARVDSRLRPR